MTSRTLDIDTTNVINSINDLRDKYHDGERLQPNEFAALQNFDRYRLSYLNSAESVKEFDQRFLELQVKANLASYLDFVNFENIR